MNIILPDEIIIKILGYYINTKEIINVLYLSKNINNLLFEKIIDYLEYKKYFNKIIKNTIFPKKIITKLNKIKIINVLKGSYKDRELEPILCNY